MKKNYSSSFILRNFPQSPQKAIKTPSSNLKPRLKRLSPVYSNASFRIPKARKPMNSENSSTSIATKRKTVNKFTPKSHHEDSILSYLPQIPSLSKMGHKRTMSSITTTDATDSFIFYPDNDRSHGNLKIGNELDSLDFRDFNPMVTPTSTSDEFRTSNIAVYNQPFAICLEREQSYSIRRFKKIVHTPDKPVDTPYYCKPFVYKSNPTPAKYQDRKSSYNRNVSYSKISLTSSKSSETSYTKLQLRRLKSKSPEKTPEKYRKIYR